MLLGLSDRTSWAQPKAEHAQRCRGHVGKKSAQREPTFFVLFFFFCRMFCSYAWEQVHPLSLQNIFYMIAICFTCTKHLPLQAHRKGAQARRHTNTFEKSQRRQLFYLTPDFSCFISYFSYKKAIYSSENKPLCVPCSDLHCFTAHLLTVVYNMEGKRHVFRISPLYGWRSAALCWCPTVTFDGRWLASLR